MNHHRTLAAGLLSATIALSGVAAATTTAHATDSKRERYDVAITVSDHEPEVGDKVKVKGFVGPAAPGQRVLLQAKYAGQEKWKTVDTARLKKNSTYKFKEKVDTVRARTYRVVKPAVGRHDGRAVSQREKVTVFGWRPLTTQVAAASNGIYHIGTMSMNGLPYADSLLQVAYPASDTTPRTVDYNLNRDCKELTATAGLSDDSPAAGSATVSLATDGVSRFSGTFALTQTAPVSLDLTDVFRLTLTSTPANGGRGALGSPRVLCSF